MAAIRSRQGTSDDSSAPTAHVGTPSSNPMKIGGSAVSTGLRAANGGAPSLSTSTLAPVPTMYHSPVGSAEGGRGDE